MDSDITSICFHGKGILRNFTFCQKYTFRSHNETDVWPWRPRVAVKDEREAIRFSQNDSSARRCDNDVSLDLKVKCLSVSSTLETCVFMGNNYSDNLHSNKNYRGKYHFTMKMFKMSERLILEQSDEIFESVSNQLGKFSMETVISGQWWRSHQSLACKGLRILRFCIVSWKDESEPNIKYCLGTTVGMVHRFIAKQNSGRNRRRTDGIRVKYFPRIVNIGACPRSPKVHEQNERTRTIPKTNYLHVDVQWHHMEK